MQTTQCQFATSDCSLKIQLDRMKFFGELRTPRAENRQRCTNQTLKDLCIDDTPVGRGVVEWLERLASLSNQLRRLKTDEAGRFAAEVRLTKPAATRRGTPILHDSYARYLVAPRKHDLYKLIESGSFTFELAARGWCVGQFEDDGSFGALQQSDDRRVAGRS